MGNYMNMLRERMKNIFDLLLNTSGLIGVYTFFTRWILPLLAIIIFFRCIYPLLQDRKENNIWGYLGMKDGSRISISHWENSIGRSKLSDIVIPLVFISRNHAVLSFNGKEWSIYDMGSKGGIEVNGNKIEHQERVEEGDTISLAGVEFVLLPAADGSNSNRQIQNREMSTALNANMSTGVTFILILLFQIISCIQMYLSSEGELNMVIPLTFLLFIIVECVYYFVMRLSSRKYFELELLVYFLCGINLLVVSYVPNALYKQLVAIVGGIIIYTLMQILLQDLRIARKLKYVLAAMGLILLVLNLTIGETRYGAKNWINLGFITFQPLEFVKVSFVIAGAATLDKLLTTKNLTAFILYSGACIGVLILIRDLGTAVIFFGAFLVIAFMRSGDLRTIALISSGALIGAMVVIYLMPYIASRFAVWGHAWENPDSTGYQQTRTMIAAASGGMLGVGGGNGYLINIPAADTDLVFGLICEEWGLLIAIIIVLIIIFFGVFATLLTNKCRSSFYCISACGVASIFLIQAALNVFGSLDILPLTGVTLPFVSNGGSSMISSWGLLAFIKSADERIRPGKANYKKGKVGV